MEIESNSANEDDDEPLAFKLIIFISTLNYLIKWKNYLFKLD